MGKKKGREREEKEAVVEKVWAEKEMEYDVVAQEKGAGGKGREGEDDRRETKKRRGCGEGSVSKTY